MRKRVAGVVLLRESGRGFGMPAWTVTKTGEFAAALDEMMAVDGPAMLHLVQDPRDASPFSGSAR